MKYTKPEIEIGKVCKEDIIQTSVELQFVDANLGGGSVQAKESWFTSPEN